MAQTVYNLVGTATGTDDAIAFVQMTRKGKLDGVLMDVFMLAADALNDGFSIQLSRSSAAEVDTNDARQPILTIGVSQEFLTSGGGTTSKVIYVPMEIDMEEGERIYLHALIRGSAGPTIYCHATIFVSHVR